MVQYIPAHITLSPKLQRLVHSTEAAGGTAKTYKNTQYVHVHQHTLWHADLARAAPTVVVVSARRSIGGGGRRDRELVVDAHVVEDRPDRGA